MSYIDFLHDPVWESETNVIYKFTNTVNGKVYIGKTTSSLRKRVINHLTVSRDWTKAKRKYFQLALNKYGIENFEIDILDRCESNEKLNEREKYWIAYYKSNDKKYGYNLTPGGDGNSDPEFCKKSIERLIKANTGSHRSQETKNILSSIQKSKWKDPEYRKNNIERAKSLHELTSKAVVQLDYSYNFIKKYKSIRDVQRLLYSNINGSLSRNLKNNKEKGFRKNGFLWMLENDYLTLKKKERRLLNT